MRRSKLPLFLSPAIMRRAFQTRLLSVDTKARRVTGVAVHRIGGYEDKSYKIRYQLTLAMPSGVSRRLMLRGSSEGQDQTRRQAYVIMRYLWLHGFDRGPWQIARPVTFWERWKLLIYQETPGTTLGHILRRPSVTARPYLERAAGWLAALHRHSPRTLKLAYNQSGRKHYWQMVLDLLSSFDNPAVTQLRQNIGRVMRFEDELAGQTKRRLVHHDFHLSNILILPQTVRVVDFGEARLSSPLIDLATFVTQLELQLRATVRFNTISRWQKIFLDAYRLYIPEMRWHSAEAQRIIRFVRFRIALQSYVASYLFGQPEGPLKAAALDTGWYHE